MEGSGKSACDLASRGESVIVETTENANQSPLQIPQHLVVLDPDGKQLNDTTLDIWAIVDRISGSPTEADSTPRGEDGSMSQSFEELVKEAGPETQDPPKSPHSHSILVPTTTGRDERPGDGPDQDSRKRKPCLAGWDDIDDERGDSTCIGVISEDKRTAETRQRKKARVAHEWFMEPGASI